MNLLRTTEHLFSAIHSHVGWVFYAICQEKSSPEHPFHTALSTKSFLMTKFDVWLSESSRRWRSLRNQSLILMWLGLISHNTKPLHLISTAYFILLVQRWAQIEFPYPDKLLGTTGIPDLVANQALADFWVFYLAGMDSIEEPECLVRAVGFLPYHWLPVNLTKPCWGGKNWPCSMVILTGGQQRLVKQSALLVLSTRNWCSRVVSINRIKWGSYTLHLNQAQAYLWRS